MQDSGQTRENAFAFLGDRLLVDADGRPWRPDGGAPVERIEDPDGTVLEIFDCGAGPAAPPAGTEPISLRDLFTRRGRPLYDLAARAWQILYWRRMYRHCPQCGAPLVRKTGGERAMRCPACGLDFFARINPAVIVAIEWDGKLLLAEREGARGRFYSLIAGFVEPGESIEDAVRREVREEVGLELASLAYVTSQPWPFPSNLMLGFEATAASAEIRPDGVEVAHAGWFAPDALPGELPRAVSIARRLIDRWLAGKAEARRP